MLCLPIPSYSFLDFISLKLATLLSVKHIRRFAQMITGGIITKLSVHDRESNFNNWIFIFECFESLTFFSIYWRATCKFKNQAWLCHIRWLQHSRLALVGREDYVVLVISVAIKWHILIIKYSSITLIPNRVPLDFVKSRVSSGFQRKIAFIKGPSYWCIKEW